MDTLTIAEVINNCIEQKILKEWHHSGYMDGWSDGEVYANIDGKLFKITVAEVNKRET